MSKITKITMEVDGSPLDGFTKIIGVLVLRLGNSVVVTEKEMNCIKGIYFDQPIEYGPLTIVSQKKGD